MTNVEVPKWLEGLPWAPEFRPTDTEFSDPIAYISKIEKEASAFGICKVIPPLPKPSKKYVFHNLNQSLCKCPELGSDVNLRDVCSSTKTDNGELENGKQFRAVFTTRQQELGQQFVKKAKGLVQPQPSAFHKQVWQSGEIYTLDQFELKSKAFARSQLGMVKEVSPLVIEALFWKAASEKPIYVEYANDVPGSGFGEPEGPFQYFHRRRKRRRQAFNRNNGRSSDSKNHQIGIMICNNVSEDVSSMKDPNSNAEALKEPTSSLSKSSDKESQFSRSKGSNAGNEMEGSAGWKLANSPWNLQVIARSPGSLTRFMPDDIPGVTSPMVYIGMLFSWFAWHVEDHELHSLNFLHTGSPKTWYAVPGDYAFTFEEVIRMKAYEGTIDRLAALTLLGEKTTLLSPEVVVASGIPCCRLVQNPGEFVVTFPRAYHVGFSHGFNCGEAANFSTPQWLSVAKEAAVRRAAINYLPMLSHQQLLYLLTMSFVSRVPRSLLPGVRSSRLRDRQREERELLVKKAFVKDILNENNLLNILLQKNSSFHAVYWDLESLPSSCKASEFCNSNASAAFAPGESIGSDGNNYKDLYKQMDLYMDTMNDFYLDDNFSSDFQVDSGTLPCVACGILGFPFMSVVQPSEEASADLMFAGQHIVEDVEAISPAKFHASSGLNGRTKGSVSGGENLLQAKNMMSDENNLVNCPNEACSDSKLNESLLVSSHSPSQNPASFPGVKYEKGWNISSGFLRPRIFCLEHAIQIEELLHAKGGANVRVICHSDFRKIKAQAMTVAEEIGSCFNFNEIEVVSASVEDLKLIDLAIDEEENDECEEDWTSKLCINLRHCVKVRKNSLNEKLKHALKLDGLLFDTTHSSSHCSFKWKSRKSRSKRFINHPFLVKQLDSVEINRDNELAAKPEGNNGRQEVKLIQYSRRKYKSKPCSSAKESKDNANCQSTPPVDNFRSPDTNGRITQVNNDDKTNYTENSSSTLDLLDSGGKAELQHEVDVIVVERVAIENPVLSKIADSQAIASPQIENFEIQSENNVIVEEKACDSTSKDLNHSVMKVAEKNSEKRERLCYEKSADSTEIGVQHGENIETTDETNGSMTTYNFGNHCVHADGDVLIKEVDDSVFSLTRGEDRLDGFDKTAVEKSGMNNEVLDCVSKFQLETKIIVHVNEEENVSSDITLISEIAPALVKESLEVLSVNCSVPDNMVMDSTNSDIQHGGRNGKKRKIDAELKIDGLLRVDGFIRSPCEGLRPRGGIGMIESALESNKTREEKVAKGVRKASEDVIPRKDKKENQKGSSHKCNLEGCRMSFQTKAELLLHKRNQCPHEGCRKKFTSHRYAMLHERVHDDDRPLKCSWEGCSMSFKWAWARTEHLRVHTGERPYKCKVEGCGLTFRFVSDFSRHRRKTGHYVSLVN